MALDPILFKKFHKPGSDVPVPPKAANPPPSKPKVEKPTVEEKDIVEIIEEAGFKVAFDIPAGEIDLPAEKQWTGIAQSEVEARGHAAETQAESQDEVDVEADEEIAALEAPIESKEITVFEAPAAAHEDAGPVFKDRLQLLDNLVSSELGISPYTVDVIRSHVKQIMMDLVTQPELDAILIDRDVHNVLAFIRYVKVDAAEAREVVKVKKTAKATKDSKFRSFDLDLTALGNAISKGQGLPLSLEDLSKFK